MQGARLVNKGGKIGIKRNNLTFDQEYERNKNKRIRIRIRIRKGIRAVWVLTPLLFSYSILTSRLGRKKGSYFFVLLLTINLSLKGVELSTETKELIVTLSQSVQNKALTVKTVKHSKNDYHECFRQVSRDWHSGD